MAAELESALEPAWSRSEWSAWAASDVRTLDQLQSHHSSDSEVSFQTSQNQSVDDKPLIMSRNLPFSRSCSNSFGFSSRLGIDPMLDHDSMASQTKFGRIYKFGTGLGPARSETTKDQSNVPSPEWASSASQLRPSHQSSRQSSDNDKQLLPSSSPPTKPPMSPHTDVGSLVSTTRSDGLPRRVNKARRNVTRIPRYQFGSFNSTPPSAPRSNAATPRRHSPRDDSASPMASKYRRTCSARNEEPSGGDLLVPGSRGGI